MTPVELFDFRVFPDKLNGLCQALQARGFGSALTVGAGYLGTISDKPLAVPLDNRGKIVEHG